MTVALADLEAALQDANTAPGEQTKILADFKRERLKIASYYSQRALWQQRHRWDPNLTVPERPVVESVPGLPEEFATYFAGAIAYHLGQLDEASEHWTGLMELPPTRRHYRSTWAAFMLGRISSQSNPADSILRFQETRNLANEGFNDSLGLANASLGWEARIYFQQGDFEKALEGYLDQHAGGERSALSSIRIVIRKLFSLESPPFEALVTNPRVRRVISNYFLSPLFSIATPKAQAQLDQWITALESQRVLDTDLAEPISWSLYRLGKFGEARRWIKRADPDSPMSQWLLAKLHLREGNQEAAAQLYAKLVQNILPTTRGADLQNVYVDRGEYGFFKSPGKHQVHGERAIIQLSQEDFVQALHSLMQSGSWLDAAYVAERVLTVDELKAYVDDQWPELDDSQQASYGYMSHELSKPALTDRLRRLLARRLLREQRWNESQRYFYPPYQNQAQRVGHSIRYGRDSSHPLEKRAEALWTAAFILRYDGLALIATELAPDWKLYQGNLQPSPLTDERLDLGSWPMFTPSQNEIDRVQASTLRVNERYHYRYVAANIAWEAAHLLPDEHPDTARMLCQAGTWLKIANPKAADRFFKALVNRCGTTRLGKRAAALNWFPPIAKDGSLIETEKQKSPQREPATPEATNSP